MLMVALTICLVVSFGMGQADLRVCFRAISLQVQLVVQYCIVASMVGLFQISNLTTEFCSISNRVSRYLSQLSMLLEGHKTEDKHI